MKNLTIGTAGHVDHGKTMLVKALTGIDTDRLKEEKERGISIELGFAFIDLPGGQRAGMVDVPGHERFIRNMLAGVGGIDIVLFVIAADEGVMPQTREHMDIIQLLQVKHGVVALTKTDLVDAEWIALVKEEIAGFLKGTTLEGAPLIEVSAVTGQGIDRIKATLVKLVGEVEQRSAGGPIRLPVDRVFSVAGFGTVVTGTLISGSAASGDAVEVLPQGIRTRIRNVHVHGKKVERAVAGQRSALNLTGVEVEQVPRGSVVASIGYLKPTRRLDVRLQLLSSAKALKHRARVRIYLGTAEVFGRVLLLDRDELEPGQWAYVQFILEAETVAAKGDRFVIRQYSPMVTIGGGSVIDTQPVKHRRFKKEVIESIATREKGTPGDLVRQLLDGSPKMLNAGEIARATGTDSGETGDALLELTRRGAVLRFAVDGVGYYTGAGWYRQWAKEVKDLLAGYHREYPLREGYPKEELRSRKFSGFSARQFQAILQSLEADGIVRINAGSIADPAFTPEPDSGLKSKLSALELRYRESSLQPPAWSDAAAKAGLNQGQAGEALQYLIRQGVLVKVADELYFHSTALAAARDKLAGFFATRGKITVGEARDILSTSRKYALPLLEFFDREKLTRRVGDVRVPGRQLNNRN